MHVIHHSVHNADKYLNYTWKEKVAIKMGEKDMGLHPF